MRKVHPEDAALARRYAGNLASREPLPTRQQRREAEREAAKLAAQDASGHTARRLAQAKSPEPITEESERRRIDSAVKWGLRKSHTAKPRGG